MAIVVECPRSGACELQIWLGVGLFVAAVAAPGGPAVDLAFEAMPGAPRAP